MMRHRWVFAPLVLVAIAGFTLIIMLLWNSLMPAIFHLSEITFFQALGILILSKILFGSHFSPYHRGGHYSLRHKIASMTPEERENFFRNLRERRSYCWGKEEESHQPETEKNPI